MPSSATEHQFSRASRPDRRQERTSQVEASAYHEAGRLIFCLYFGIPVESIVFSGNSPRVKIRFDSSNTDQQVAAHYYQVVLSGELAVKRFLKVETLDHIRDQADLTRLFARYNPARSGDAEAFHDEMAACRRRVIIHMADPKMASAIRFAASYIQGEQSTVSGRRLDALLRVVFRMMTVK